MATTFPLKQGSTFSMNAQFTDDVGTPIDITSVTLTAQVRDVQGTLVSNCVITKTVPTNGQFTIVVADTTGWPPTQLRCDVCYVQGDSVLYSDTFFILVTAPVTAPPVMTP